jgi:hypothetical protein
MKPEQTIQFLAELLELAEELNQLSISSFSIDL